MSIQMVVYQVDETPIIMNHVRRISIHEDGESLTVESTDEGREEFDIGDVMKVELSYAND